jgi:polysaccharide export outer membrane protein
MKNQIKKILVLVIMANVLVNCASKDKVAYFQEVEGVKVQDAVINFEPEIQVGDLLAINVSAVEGATAVPFNLYEKPVVGNTMSNAEPIKYLVNADGDINFPVFGKIKVAGLTTKKLTDNLAEKIKPYIKDPIINVRITNFKITVLGQVKSPGTFSIPNERISVLEAIGLAGDLEIHGQRKNVMLIREQNGKRVFVNIDLTNKALFASPYFYLAQNDVLYVEPNKVEVNGSAVGANTGVILGSISILLSIITILLI